MSFNELYERISPRLKKSWVGSPRKISPSGWLKPSNGTRLMSGGGAPSRLDPKPFIERGHERFGHSFLLPFNGDDLHYVEKIDFDTPSQQRVSSKFTVKSDERFNFVESG